MLVNVVRFFDCQTRCISDPALMVGTVCSVGGDIFIYVSDQS